jgi:hypothetical protein
MHAWFRSRVPSVAQPGHWYGGESCIKIRGGNTKKTLKNLTLPASTKKKAVPPLARKKAEPPPSTHLGGPVLLLPHLAAPLIFPHLLLSTISLSLSLSHLLCPSPAGSTFPPFITISLLLANQKAFLPRPPERASPSQPRQPLIRTSQNQSHWLTQSSPASADLEHPTKTKEKPPLPPSLWQNRIPSLSHLYRHVSPPFGPSGGRTTATINLFISFNQQSHRSTFPSPPAAAQTWQIQQNPPTTSHAPAPL